MGRFNTTRQVALENIRRARELNEANRRELEDMKKIGKVRVVYPSEPSPFFHAGEVPKQRNQQEVAKEQHLEERRRAGLPEYASPKPGEPNLEVKSNCKEKKPDPSPEERNTEDANESAAELLAQLMKSRPEKLLIHVDPDAIKEEPEASTSSDPTILVPMPVDPAILVPVPVKTPKLVAPAVHRGRSSARLSWNIVSQLQQSSRGGGHNHFQSVTDMLRTYTRAVARNNNNENETSSETTPNGHKRRNNVSKKTETLLKRSKLSSNDSDGPAPEDQPSHIAGEHTPNSYRIDCCARTSRFVHRRRSKEA
ncbi:hypothetical protein L596_028351 [Steinernema carpocapsae]|uniref:Uncharacterized protein n=1 Tax=Steinernema carpocapsae TaxID=34508 RepID=A0A4U5LY60_STECR|nr:hypothetical protein L596_028351 [Steinernema carpocapsae]